jgi:hypothetical protein
LQAVCAKTDVVIICVLCYDVVVSANTNAPSKSANCNSHEYHRRLTNYVLSVLCLVNTFSIALHYTGMICPLESDAVVNWAVTPADSYSAFLTALQSSSSSSSSSSTIGDATPCATAIMPPTASITTATADDTGAAAEGERTVCYDYVLHDYNLRGIVLVYVSSVWKLCTRTALLPLVKASAPIQCAVHKIIV